MNYVHRGFEALKHVSTIMPNDAIFLGPFSEVEVAMVQARAPFGAGHLLASMDRSYIGLRPAVKWLEHERTIPYAPDSSDPPHFSVVRKLGPPEVPKKTASIEINDVKFTLDDDRSFVIVQCSNYWLLVDAAKLGEFLNENLPKGGDA